jgi:hypothetical protein
MNSPEFLLLIFNNIAFLVILSAVLMLLLYRKTSSRIFLPWAAQTSDSALKKEIPKSCYLTR